MFYQDYSFLFKKVNEEAFDEAVMLYRKAEARDPEGFVGDNARHMLGKISAMKEGDGH